MDLSVQLENVLSSSYDVCFTSMPSVIHADIPSCVSQEDKLPPLSLPFLSKNEVFGPFTRAERAHSDASGSEDSSSSSLLLSPIESVIDESKSPRELAVLLKKVHAALRSREAELKVVTEIGRTLLENNLELQKKRQMLLERNQQREKHLSTTQPVITPSTSILTRTASNNTEAERILQQHMESDEQPAMKFISRQQADEAIMDMLRQKNHEVQTMIDATLAQQSQAAADHATKVQQLESRIKELQEALHKAAETIDALERARQGPYRHRSHTCEAEEDDHNRLLLLKQRLQSLEAENQRLVRARNSVETELSHAVENLKRLQQRKPSLKTMRERYEQQKEAAAASYDNHPAKIVQGYRNELSRLHDCQQQTLYRHPTNLLEACKRDVTQAGPSPRNSFKKHDDGPGSVSKDHHHWRSVLGPRDRSHVIDSSVTYFRPKPWESDAQRSMSRGPSSVFQIIARWCRFSVVLTLAILINLWNGPDKLPENW